MQSLIQHHGVRDAETVLFLLMIVIIMFGALARRIQIAYPIVLVVAGVVIGSVPGLPKLILNPDIIFLTILPPLLFHAAWQTSWREFHYNIVSILMLAIGLVFFTVLGVGAAAAGPFSLLGWRSGIVLGAIIAPTDAIAATSIARRVGLSGRTTHVLEGESLVNDATGLLALEFGLSIALGGHLPSAGHEFGRFAWLTTGGITIGIAIAWLVRKFEGFIDDGPIEIALSLVTPFVAYFAAEEAHASGVLSVVACGLYFGRHSSEFFSPGVRLQAKSVWHALDFILNGFAFVLIGLQLPTVLAALEHYGLPVLISYAAGFSALIVALRLIWVYPGAWVAYVIRRRLLKQDEKLPSVKALFIVGWTGMRGVVSLAAAMSLPETTAAGMPFQTRDLIIFLSFSAILSTLVLQGLTLPALISFLGFKTKGTPDREEHDARRLMVDAALAHIRDRQKDHGGDDVLLNTLLEMEKHHQKRLMRLDTFLHGHGSSSDQLHFRQISHELLTIERSIALALRNEGKINDIVLRRLEHELDLAQSRLDLI